MNTGTCKHGEFDLEKGCPQCLAERRKAGIKPENDEMEDGLNAEGLKADGLNAEGLNADGLNADGLNAEGANSALNLSRSSVVVKSS